MGHLHFLWHTNESVRWLLSVIITAKLAMTEKSIIDQMMRPIVYTNFRIVICNRYRFQSIYLALSYRQVGFFEKSEKNIYEEEIGQITNWFPFRWSMVLRAFASLMLLSFSTFCAICIYDALGEKAKFKIWSFVYFFSLFLWTFQICSGRYV